MRSLYLYTVLGLIPSLSQICPRRAPARYKRRIILPLPDPRGSGRRFLAASSTFGSWFLGRLGMMGPETKAPSLLSSGAVSDAAASRRAGPFRSRNPSSTTSARL